jgi:hypothetical protein
MQAIIATQAHTALDDVAQLADKIAEVAPPPFVVAVSNYSSIQECVTQNTILLNNSRFFNSVPCENFIYVSIIVEEKITLF